MFKHSFNPNPLFYSVGYETRDIKATEKQILAFYNAGAHGLKKDEEIAIFAGLQLSEYRQICQNDPVAERAAEAGYVHGKLEHTTMMMDRAREGDVKATSFILTHIYDMMPAKPKDEVGENNKLVIEVRNAATGATITEINPNHPMPKVVGEES